MPTIDIHDTQIHYERSGQGPAILFVHGLFGDGDAWTDQAARLADHYSCVRYDRRGHTSSGRGDLPIDTRRHADDAAALIEALDLAPCLLVGSSGGAVIGVDVALRYPHLLRGAVFSEPPLFSLDSSAGRAIGAEIGPSIDAATAAGDPRAAVDAFMQHICPGLWAILDEARKDCYRANADIGLTDLPALRPDITADQLATITVPALVIAGTDSHAALRTVTHRLATGLANARFVELEGSGHVTYAEQPDAFATAVGAFAAEVDRYPNRFDVRATDGVPIAVWGEGSGPPVVLVHGTLSDHNGFEALVAELCDRVTTFAVDRRGYGSSGDADDYSIEREFADIAAVVDAVAARTGRPVALCGHSYGANCAIGGATLTGNVSHLVIYEPSLGLGYPPGAVAAMEAALAGGERETVLLAVLAPLELTTDEIDELRAGPRWPVLLAGAANGPREGSAEEAWDAGYAPFAGITVTTLFLSGDQSPPAIEKLTREAAAAIPNAEVRVLEGHAHFAHRTDPALVAAVIHDFVAG